MALDLGDEAELKVLAADEGGLLLRLEWERFRALLVLGEQMELAGIVDYPGISPVTALLLPEGIDDPSQVDQWVSHFHPQVVLSAEYGAYLESNGETPVRATVLSTPINGWIELSTDGEQMWVEAERR
jgi:hypothetical protein